MDDQKHTTSTFTEFVLSHWHYAAMRYHGLGPHQMKACLFFCIALWRQHTLAVNFLCYFCSLFHKINKKHSFFVLENRSYWFSVDLFGFSRVACVHPLNSLCCQSTECWIILVFIGFSIQRLFEIILHFLLTKIGIFC